MVHKESWDDIQQAFLDERITLEQLISILIDNFGLEEAMRIIGKNINWNK